MLKYYVELILVAKILERINENMFFNNIKKNISCFFIKIQHILVLLLFFLTQVGQITCYVESCPLADCEAPVKVKGDCCPVCIKQNINTKKP